MLSDFKNIFGNPLFYLAALAMVSSLIFSFRGLKTISWRNFIHFFVPLTCLFVILALFPDIFPRKLIKFAAAIIVVCVSLSIIIDFLLGLFLKLKRAIFLGRDLRPPLPEYLLEICRAMEILANRRTGALIILEGKEKLKGYVDGGIFFDAQIKAEILTALFAETSPVHDGALIVSNGRIRRIKAILSLTTDTVVPLGLGTRHRSAIGITEKTDAIALVVSEERGEVSIAYKGCLMQASNQKELQRLLKLALKGKTINKL